MTALALSGSRELELVGAPASRNPAAVYLSALAPTGRAGMLSRLRKVAAILGGPGTDPLALPWHTLRYEHVAAIRARLEAEGLAPATVNLTLAALRGIAKAAFGLGLLDADALERIRQVKPVRGERLPAGRALSAGELAALMDVCANDPTAAGARDGAILAMLYTCGLRRAELVALPLEAYNPETGELRVLKAKGGKQRIVYVDNGAAAALRDWLEVRGTEPGPLFTAVNRGGRVVAGGMSGQALYAALRKRAEQAGVAAFTPHDLRRTCVSDLLDAGADVVTVQHIAGHSSPLTTARYDRRPDAAKRKAQNLLHVPYRSRRLAMA